MFQQTKKTDAKHAKNLIVISYENSKGKASTKCKHPEVIELVKGLPSGDGSCHHAIYKQRLDDHTKNLILIHLGNLKSSDDDLRQTFAKVYRSLEHEKIRHAELCIDSVKANPNKGEKLAGLLSEALQVAAYKYIDIFQKKKDAYKLSIQYSANKSISKAIEEGSVVADAINFARELGDTPGNLMTPSILAKRTQEKARNSKIKVSVWDKARIEKEKFGLMLSVAQGSSQPPRVIIMEYKGGNKSQKPITFVGKGLTFDSGGISLKPGAGMEEMKYDMCGAANIIGAMFAIAGLGLKVNVTAMIGSTENMPGPSATKPGDVFTARNGKTVEVNNTDAEGRLVLGDVLAYAAEKKPAAIIDAATLTGAMLIALGNLHTGYFTTNDKLAKKVDDAAKNADESVWRMPVTKGHSDDIKGTFADLSNIGSTRNAGSATAAAFLKEFVPEEIPYAHFDIAGTAWNCQGRSSLFRKGATGTMVRTFTQLAKIYK
tara:strand:+ start:7961 stop:9424 length:1464 start_codon:yes stop_codon:yes gene_type:complete